MADSKPPPIANLQRALLRQHAAERMLKEALRKAIRAKADALAAERELHLAAGTASARRLRELEAQVAELSLAYEAPLALVEAPLGGVLQKRLVGL
jgi:hypothetical protein